jgi:hypothetical protein
MITSEAENNALIKGLKKSDSQCLELFLPRLYSSRYAYVNKFLNDTDEAEVFCRLWRHKVRINDPLIFQEKNYF